MPPTTQSARLQEAGTSFKEQNYDYAYPRELDLKPGSDLHDKLVEHVTNRARESRNTMQKRYDTWRKVDNSLTCFRSLSDEEQAVKDGDDRKPVSMVVPQTYAALEILLTYKVQTFLSRTTFQYDGVGPEDLVGAALMEQLVQDQFVRGKMGLALHTQWRDSYAYGIGVVTPVWEQKFGRVSVTKTNELPGGLVGTTTKSKKRGIRYEGHALENINAYNFLPDPGVSAHEIQKAEYVGWLSRTNRMNLLEKDAEVGDGEFFNVQYLRALADARSSIALDYADTDESGRSTKTTPGSNMDTAMHRNPVDLIHMFVNLVPSEWKLGSEQRPEKWYFVVAADMLVIQAKPLGLDHNMFPVAVDAPDFDGYSTSPISKLEILNPLQEALDWLFNSHITNVRKAINDVVVYDPSVINQVDMENPKPGKLIRLRRSAWGKNIKDSIFQLEVQDVTRGNIADASLITDMIRTISGATDSLEGAQRSGSERISAQEARGTKSSAMSRLDKAAKLTTMMCLNDLGYMLASQTAQLLGQDTYVKLVGRNAELLRRNYQGDRVPVSPGDLDVDYDVRVADEGSSGANYIDAWIQIFQSLVSQPEVAMQYNMPGIMDHIAMLTGARDIENFHVKVMPDQQIQQQVQAGNMVPVTPEQAGAAFSG